ncbi:MAG: hypothetical protein V3U65_10485 [Granulosicoccaceae bacterium]
MTNKKSTQYLYLAMACLSLLLTSCDGGLFGTGDGHNNSNVMVNGDATGGTTGNMETGATTDTSTGTTTSATTGSTTDGQSTAAFDNMQPGGQSPTPQMRVLNLTQLNVQVRVNDNAVINELLPEQDSGRIALPIDASQLAFTDVATLSTTNQAAFHTIEPFNAAEFSITTIIMRRQPNDSIGVITLTTQTVPTDPAMALARLVQTTILGDVSGSSTITLVVTEPSHSGSDVSFDGLSYDTQATAYAGVFPGNYTLTDTDNRFVSQSITIEAGHVYTIVISSETTPVLRVIDDSQ